MPKVFKDSLKGLEADIQHANTVASAYPVDYTGAYYQMRLYYNPMSHLLLPLLQWVDCSVASYLGLLTVIIYKIYVDGKTSIIIHERKATMNYRKVASIRP